MVASYTSNLRLTKQGDNDNPNSWGQVVNTQVIQLIEDAVAGVKTVDITGSSDVNLSTSVVNGGTDDARYAVLQLTGIIGTNINLILPSVNKIYIIRSSYTGDYTVTVKPVGASSGIAMSKTQTVFVYTNGTNIYEVSPAALLIANNLSDLANVATARTNLGLGSLAVKSTINNEDWSGTDLAIDNGGHGASTAEAGLNNLLPTQTGNSGKFLSTNGTTHSWASSGVENIGKGCMVTNTANQGLSSSLAKLTWNNEVYDDGAYHDNSTNPQRLTAAETGVYIVQLGINFNNPQNAMLEWGFITNGTAISSVNGANGTISQMHNYFTDAYKPMQKEVSTVLKLNAGDYVEAYARGNGEGTVRANANLSYFKITRII